MGDQGEWFTEVKSQMQVLKSIFDGDIDRIRGLMQEGLNMNRGYRSLDGFDTPLHYASRVNNFNIVKLLVEGGADVNNDKDGENLPLCAAVFNQSEIIVRYLLEHGANANVMYRDYKGGKDSTHVLFLALGKSTTIFQLLLKYGANPSCMDNMGGGILEDAVHRKYPRFVELLLEYGSNVNMLNSLGRSPIFYCKRGEDDTAILLLQHGAMTNFKDYYGKSIRYYLTRTVLEYIETQRILLLFMIGFPDDLVRLLYTFITN